MSIYFILDRGKTLARLVNMVVTTNIACISYTFYFVQKSYFYRQVDGDDVAEPLLVVEDCGEVGDEHYEGGGDVYGHDCTKYIPLEPEPDTDSHLSILERFIGDLRVSESVLLHFFGSDPLYDIRMCELEKILILN